MAQRSRSAPARLEISQFPIPPPPPYPPPDVFVPPPLNRDSVQCLQCRFTEFRLYMPPEYMAWACMRSGFAQSIWRGRRIVPPVAAAA
eukprot:5615818-Karenia_brevis.AAC.1